ncbi:hypothetical protein LTR62_003939 [Meristemomyces frigidus]|uniref:Uncharacterized protein n=1 Tax=Meristemomyces frigidus TaxID=1508187 RepID=A0AAN7YK80_9PEZI|nr:hypothetical protein LTR62_003939 [Meristemomyces frigidus]
MAPNPPMEEAARNRHLSAASDLLIISSPQLSSYLQMQTLQNRSQSGILQTKAEGDICLACGTKLLPGWSCKVLRQVSKGGKPRRNDGLSLGAKMRKVQCFRCNTISSLSRGPWRPRDLSGKLARHVPTATTTTVPDGTEPATTTIPAGVAKPALSEVASSSSRKARSKKSSLQALLGNRVPAPGSGKAKYSLGLEDFMKS